MPSFDGNLFTQWHQITSKKLETLGYHMVKTRSLYLTWPWIRTGSWRTDRQTDGRTDRIPIANTRSQQYLPVQLWRVITLVVYYFAAALSVIEQTVLLLCEGSAPETIQVDVPQGLSDMFKRLQPVAWQRVATNINWRPAWRRLPRQSMRRSRWRSTSNCCCICCWKQSQVGLVTFTSLNNVKRLLV